jgi:hypothetical protein
MFDGLVVVGRCGDRGRFRILLVDFGRSDTAHRDFHALELTNDKVVFQHLRECRYRHN